MRMRELVHSRNLRFAAWTVVIGSVVAVAVSAPFQPGKQQQGRKSTDPPVAARGKMGQDLFLAIDHHDLAGVEGLIKKGADPNSRNGLEFTPLCIAAASHQDDVMKALLHAGAEPDTKTTYGSPLTFAAATANFDGANILLDRGADPNTARSDGLTVLMMACNTGEPRLIGELLKRKADVNATDDNGTTALLLAARHGNDMAGKLLLDAGAPVDTADDDQQTALMAAAANGQAGFVQMLLQKGANVNSHDAKGRTSLILAAEYGDYPAVVKALLKAGANPKGTDASGRTAADYAAVRGYRQSLALLGKPSHATPVRSPHQAIGVSLKILQSSMKEFTKMASCVSCHQEGLGRMTTGTAQSYGFKIDPQVNQTQEGRLNGGLNALRPLHEGALKNPDMMKQVPLIEINEVTTGDSWLLSGMAAHNQPATPATAAMTLVMARQQLPDGHWGFSVPRAPMQSSFFTFTALAVRALNVYGPKTSAAEISQRVRRAKAWLLKTKPQNSEDRASLLLGLKWSGATAADLRRAASAIRADRHPDGGWGQLPGMPSDAYATGQALYALHVGGGVPVTDPVYKKGIQFLLRTQDDDGSWFVNKRAIPINNYFDAGFPHGESQYASFNGTCWATLALLESVGRSH